MDHYIIDIFIIFKSRDHLKRFQSYLNSCHSNISFTIETEQNNKIPFLDVNIIRKQSKFTTNVYRKPSFGGVYTHFVSCLPSTFKIGIIYTLLNSRHDPFSPISRIPLLLSQMYLSFTTLGKILCE